MFSPSTPALEKRCMEGRTDSKTKQKSYVHEKLDPRAEVKGHCKREAFGPHPDTTPPGGARRTLQGQRCTLRQKWHSHPSHRGTWAILPIAQSSLLSNEQEGGMGTRSPHHMMYSGRLSSKRGHSTSIRLPRGLLMDPTTKPKEPSMKPGPSSTDVQLWYS